jgi:hypothetical protein
MGIQVELLHTSNYDLRHTSNPGLIITAGVETTLRVWEGGTPDPDGFTIANGNTGRTTTYIELPYTTHQIIDLRLRHTNHWSNYYTHRSTIYDTQDNL